MWCYRGDTPSIEMIHVSSMGGSVLFVDDFKKPVGPCIKPKRRLSEGHRGSFHFEPKRRLSEGPCILSPTGG